MNLPIPGGPGKKAEELNTNVKFRTSLIVPLLMQFIFRERLIWIRSDVF